MIIVETFYAIMAALRERKNTERDANGFPAIHTTVDEKNIAHIAALLTQAEMQRVHLHAEVANE